MFVTGEPSTVRPELSTPREPAAFQVSKPCVGDTATLPIVGPAVAEATSAAG